MADSAVERMLHDLRTADVDLGMPVDISHVFKGFLRTESTAKLSASYSQFRRHMAVLGVSGAGKSKFLELLGRHLFDSLNGFTFIDPHGDTVEALLEYAVHFALEHGDDAVFDRLHYLQPSSKWCFSYDPYAPLIDEGLGHEPTMRSAAATRSIVDQMMKVFLRHSTEAEQDIMRRLKKWLSNVLTGIATPIDESGNRLTLSDAYVLLDVAHGRHEEFFLRLEPRLPEEVQRDFAKLHKLQRPQDRDALLESTDNKLSEILKPLTRAIYGREAPSIDLRQIVSQRHTLLVNLKETDDLRRESSKPIAGLLIQQITDVCKLFSDRDERVPHFLIIDEAHEFIGEDLGMFLDQARKWQLSACLAGQHLSSFRKGEIDLTDQLLDNCKTVVCFQQKNIEDVEELGKYLGYPNYQLQERYSVMDRPDPSKDEIMHLKDVGRSSAKHKAHTDVRSRGNAQTHSSSQQHTSGTGDGEGTSDHAGESVGAVHGIQNLQIDGMIVPLPTASAINSLQKASGRSRNAFASESTSHANMEAQTLIEGSGEADTIGESKGLSVTKKQTLVQRTREEWQPTGEPRFALPYQNAIHEYLLTTLPDQFALVRSKIDNIEQTILFRVRDVPDVFAHPEQRQEIVGEFLERLYASKSYMFRPMHPDVAQKERLDKLVRPVPAVENAQQQDARDPFIHSNMVKRTPKTAGNE